MADSKSLSKQEEIALLEKLANGNGYFAEYFGKEVPTMVENIKSDFPIDIGTRFSEAEGEIESLNDRIRSKEEEIQRLERSIERMEKIVQKYDDKFLRILEFAVKSGNTDITNLYEMGMVVRYKVMYKIDLTDKEFNFLSQKLCS